ncbi:MATE family efflux transporter [Gracilimonas sp. Q87]|uniref:MATE family efflux transporter n=1 Tax=Gracilimonas sp. Q87 TaxID=3384766 RepID=UPI0039845666
MRHSKKDIKKEGQKLLQIGSPIIATQLISMGLNFTDTVMAGNLSALDLAAVAIGNAIFMPIAIFCMATLIAINPVVSQFLGARKFEEIGKSARQLLWLILLLSIPAFFLLRNIEIIMHWLNVTPEIIPIAGSYLKAISWGTLPLLVYSGIRYFSEGLSVTKPAMYIAIGALLVNIGANYVLMYGKLGFPELGAVGTGYATSIVCLFEAVVFVAFTASFKPFKRFNIFARTKGPEWKYIRELIRIGIPNGVSSSMEILLFAAVSLLMGSLSIKAAAAHQIAINVASAMFMIPLGLSMAISQRVGFSLGQGSVEKARFRGFVGIGICAGVMTLTAILLFLAPDLIISIYTKDPEVATVAVSLLFMAAVFQISDGLQVGGFGALRGLKDTRIPMVVNFISYWLIGFPVGYYLGIIRNIGPEGLWIGLISGLTVAAVLHNYRFNKLTKGNLRDLGSF